MTTETKFLGIILIITIVLLVGGVFLLSQKGPSQTQTIINPVVSQIDYSKGGKIGTDSAKIKLVEFSDFQCPACLVAEPYVRKLRTDYPTQIQFIYKEFPLAQHNHSREAATLAEAAAEQGKFWEMHDKLFDTQTQWSGMNDVIPFFLDLAKQLGLDENKVKQALQQNSFKAKFDDSIAEGERIGVDAVPTFFLNGHKLNLQNFSDLNTVIAEELKK